MTSAKRRSGFKKWLPGLFLPKDEVCVRPDGPQRQRQSGTGGFFNNAEGFVMTDPTMTSVQGDNNTVINMQGTVTQMMSLLSQHIIHGAAHDDSARDPPPRCHPDTRVKLIARITAWFDGKAQDELLLWITGPAGVGKSAVVQTFSEYLAKSKSLGASVFISRPNKRNKPQGTFITIAYQLATRIEQYRKFIVERLSLDPSLLNKGLAAQFMTFIVEPFVEKKIGAGGKRWGILLDGLDELRGEDAQCEIIQLISTFVLEHRNTPLVWIIASRPESHISNMFDDDEVRCSCWTEYIPIDSTDACQDVERFLRSSFKTTQKKFRHSVSSDWPSDTDFLKLTAAASGLFIYAQVVMQFIRDLDHADPVFRFQILLSVIDRSNAVPTEENPFVHLDALYTEIISSIPPILWPTAKRLLAFTIYAEQLFEVNFLGIRGHLRTLRGLSILSGIPRHAIYASLNKCRSILKIPDGKVAHKQNLTFLHASFADYLKDSSRSVDYYVGDTKDVEEGVPSKLLEIWNQCSGDDIAAASVKSTWHRYCSQLDEKVTSRDIAKFHAKVFRGVVEFVRVMAYSIFETTESLAYAQLCQVNMVKLCYYFDARGLMLFVNQLTESPSAFNNVAIYRQVHLKDLRFGYLDWKSISPAHVHYAKSGKFSAKTDWILHRPRSSVELKAFVSELESLQEFSPELPVIIFGGVPKGRIVAFQRPLKKESGAFMGFMFYVIPYHD